MIEFLLDYYIWILVVLGIIIITIIGFLVDSKQKRKKKEGKVNPTNEVKTVEPLPNVSVQEATPVVDAKNQPVPTTTDNVIGENVVPNNNIVTSQTQQYPNVTQSIQTNPTNIVSQPENSVSQGIALSEQKPHFEPREINIPSQPQMANDNVVAEPRPINPVYINQPIAQQSMQQSYQQGFAQQTSSVQNPQQGQNLQQASSVVPNGQNVNTMTGYTNVQAMPQQMQPIQNNQMPTQNVVDYNNINNSVQKPINYQNIPNQMPATQTQQPVGIIPNAPASQNVATPVQNMQQAVTSEPTQPTMTTAPNIGISFVTGETTDNNANDDAWKL